jgi:hypothetical protein
VRIMKNIILSAILLINAQMLPASDNSEYSQSYTILIKGLVAGHEKVTEKLDDAGQLISASEHEITVSDGMAAKRMAFSTKMIFSKGGYEPVSYTYAYSEGGAGDSYDVTIKDAQITRSLRRGGRGSEIKIPVPPNMVILDFNVYHQYDYLIRKYDNKKGGKQSFADFIPLIGNDIPLTMVALGDSNLKFDQGVLLVRNFRVECAGLWTGNLSVDKNGRLVQLVIPAQDLEVVRSDLLPGQEKALSPASR